MFLDEFLSEDDLFAWLTRSQIYVTPYLSEAQITSGTLTYALGAGAAVLSTPYWYASELLANGRGKLFGFAQHEALGQMILSLFDEPAKLEALRENAFEYGRELQWSRMGGRYLQLAVKVLSTPRPAVLPGPMPDPAGLPPSTSRISGG